MYLCGHTEGKNIKFNNVNVLGNDSLRYALFGLNPNIDSLIFNNFNFIGNRFIKYDQEINPLDTASAIFRNCLFYGNNYNPTDFFSTYPKLTLEYCALDTLDLGSLLSVVTSVNNLIGIDPLFRDPANGDYSLLPCSPLINAGSNLAASSIPTDIAGNPRIQEGTVDIGAYEAPAFALAALPVVKPACLGSSNGSISISPIFGCEPYIYDWLPDAGNGPQLNGLTPGNYLLTITDGSGRQILDTVSVAEAPLPVLNPVATDVQCGTTLGGSIAANVNNGTAPYHYQWQPVAADTSNLIHLSPGLYAVTVSDTNGCQDSASASIALLGMLTLLVNGQGISCHGETDGWLSATPLTGASPFSWGWQGWSGTDSIAQPLGPGFYAVTVSDAYGCTASFAFPPMTQPDSLWATVGHEDQTDPVMPNGAAVVTTISGGMAPFGFDWNTGSTQQAIAGLTAGSYTVTVTDKNGCEAVVEVMVDLMVGTTEAEGKALLLYPNPAVDWVKVVLPPQSGTWSLELSDASGRSVLRVEQATAEQTLNLHGLPSGHYLLTAKNEVSTASILVGKVLKR